MGISIEEIKRFWELNPLFVGESTATPGSAEFFAEHTRVYIEDVFAGEIPQKLLFPPLDNNAKVLDLGCGIGFWSQEFLCRYQNIELFSSDLTQSALDMTRQRLALINGIVHLSQQNAEQMSYPDDFFDHVNCQGVIHHTPDTAGAVREIACVTKVGGTAYISVYYRNFFLQNWTWISSVGGVLAKCGAGLKGRGRERIFCERDVDEITRLYDGSENPLGKSYSRRAIYEIVAPFFAIEESFLNFFPARALPFHVPPHLHRFLSKHFGFMIHLSLRKKTVCAA